MGAKTPFLKIFPFRIERVTASSVYRPMQTVFGFFKFLLLMKRHRALDEDNRRMHELTVLMAYRLRKLFFSSCKYISSMIQMGIKRHYRFLLLLSQFNVFAWIYVL